MSETIPFLDGNLTFLRGLTEQDLDGPMTQWSNDREVTRMLYRGAFPETRETAAATMAAVAANPKEVELAIVDKASGTHIGIAGIHSMNLIAHSAEFRILIGEKDFWNGGYGTEVTQLMVAYGFEVLNMNKVWLGVTADNVGAVRCYEKVGFVKEGVLRAETYRNSRYYDAVRMSILRPEYDQLRDQWAIAEKLQTQFPR
jgi:ribosomal-protein-alanine N-acetyltransferase